jgi:hypothetical protein
MLVCFLDLQILRFLANQTSISESMQIQTQDFYSRIRSRRIRRRISVRSFEPSLAQYDAGYLGWM